MSNQSGWAGVSDGVVTDAVPRVTIVKHGTRHDDHAALAADGAAVALTACGGFCIRILRFAAEPTPCPPTPRLGQPGCAEPAARAAAR